MAKRSSKNQARRNGGGGIPGWLWLVVGLLVGLAIAAFVFMGDRWKGGEGLLPKPNPEARAPARPEDPVAQDAPAPEPRKPKYDFYDVLRGEEVIPDAELNAQAQVEAEQAAQAALAAQADPADPADPDEAADAPAPTPPPADGPRYLIQAGAFRSLADADAVKARIALTGELARVESAQVEGGTIYRVRLGPYPNAGALAAAKQALASHGIDAVAIRAQ
jgi:cell division protein FtsN